MEGERFEFSGRPTFSPDGKRIAYVAIQGRVRHVVVDSEKTESLVRDVRHIVFSPDGKRLAYADHRQVVIDGVPGKKYESVGKPVFSPDGKSVAHVVRGNRRMKVVVVNGPQSSEFNAVGDPHFSEDGRTLSFGARWKRELWWVTMAAQ